MVSTVNQSLSISPVGTAPRTSKLKLVLLPLALLLLAGVVVVSLTYANSHRVTVQTTRASRQDISAVVTAAGEIAAKTYADISPTSLGQITNLYVKEGDQVHIGQPLAKLWNVQQQASVNQMKAALTASQANLNAQLSAVKADQATVASDTATLSQDSQAFKRDQILYNEQLLDRADYETGEATYKTAQASLDAAQASLQQAQATANSEEAQIKEAQAQLVSAQDQLSLTEFVSPLNGTVTYLPVHVGDTVVMGIEDSPGSTLMRISDMSTVTAEMQVDETDIAAIRVGQPVTLTIDAYGDRVFHAVVTLVGHTAILRSTGAAATSTTGSDAQQAKDFEVTVQLTDPPRNIRPGLSCTANITTATAHDALVIPLQALVERDPNQIPPPPAGQAASASPTATPQTPIQGVFLVDPQTRTAVFHPASTGVTGIDKVQVLSGVQLGDQVVSGPYSALRDLANHAAVKIDNILPAAASTTAAQ